LLAILVSELWWNHHLKLTVLYHNTMLLQLLLLLLLKFCQSILTRCIGQCLRTCVTDGQRTDAGAMVNEGARGHELTQATHVPQMAPTLQQISPTVPRTRQ
jgi:hypothetical protein